LLALAPASLWAAQVKAIRVGMDPEHTRLVLESDQPIHARVSYDRAMGALLVELDHVQVNGALSSVRQKVGANNPFLLGARVVDSATGSRLVLPVRSAVRTRLFNLKRGGGFGDRLVLDVFPTQQGGAPDRARPDQATPSTRPRPAPDASTTESPALLVQRGRAGKAQITAALVGIATDRVRLVLESDRPIQASVIRPTTPGALSIELGDVEMNAVLAELPSSIRPNPYLTTVELEQDPSGTRMRLVAPVPVEPQIFSLASGDGHRERLVIDILPEREIQPATPPAAAAGPTEKLQVVPVLPPATRPEEPAPPTQAQLAEAWFEVHLNGTPQDTVLVLRRPLQQIFVRADDLRRWRLPAECHEGIQHGGDTFCPLAGIAGLTYEADDAKGILAIHAPATLLAASHLSGVSRGIDQPTPSPPGAFVNYDFFAGRQSKGDTATSALLETGLFGRLGSGTNTLLSRRNSDGTQTTRLDTTWTRDEPDRMASLRLGDSISGTSGWGRSVRMGGVQWATNFATQPTFVTFPLPTIEGVAGAPSTVDYYVNDALRFRRDVPSGPFSIQDLPVITGAGEIRLVVRDLLGREQVISQPFYASGGILAKGLRDFSYELGFERNNYGLASNDYGRPMAVGTERRGLSNNITGEVHAELLQDQQTLGLSGDFLLGDLGLLSVSAAGSHAGRGTGGLMELGFQRQSSHLSYGARSQFTTPGFVQLGYHAPARPPRQMTSAFFSVGTTSLGSLGINYTHEDFRDREDIELVGASYSRALGRLGYLSLSALRFLGGDGSTLVSMTFTAPLGSTGNVSVNGQTRAGSTGGTVQYQRNLPTGSGVGYRLQAGLSPGNPDLAEVALQNDVGTYTLGAASSQDAHAYQASMRGGFALLAGKVFPSRHIDDSFAVVRVPGFSGVRVYADNQPIATTDEDGYALVPRLRSYQRNPIRIEQADLPMDADIQGLQVDAVPYYRSGLTLTFPVKPAHGAVVVIELQDGSFLPAGATVALQGNPSVFPVGYRGEAYLTGLGPRNTLHASWRGQSCDMTVEYPTTDDPLPRIGPVICKGVSP
jgi:outer membrane usher protein